MRWLCLGLEGENIIPAARSVNEIRTFKRRGMDENLVE